MIKSVHYYIKENGRAPFLKWINNLDMKQQVIVDRYIQRVALENQSLELSKAGRVA